LLDWKIWLIKHVLLIQSWLFFPWYCMYCSNACAH